MPEFAKPQNEQELNAQLAATIGQAVEDLMGQSGWTEANNNLIDPRNFVRQPDAPNGGGDQSTPVVTAPNGQPVSPQVTTPTPSPSVFDPEQFKFANGKYLGKYDTLDQYMKGIGHSMDMTKNVLTENEQLKQQIAALRQVPVTAPVTIPQVTPEITPTRGDTPKVSPKLAEVLASLQDGTLDAEGLLKLTAAISEQTYEAARQAAREESEARDNIARATQDRWNKVDAYMGEKFPLSMEFTKELGLFTQANPEISRVVSALIKEDLHERAMEITWREFATQHGLNPNAAVASFVPAPATPENVKKEIVMDAANQVRQEAIDQARKDAGVIPSMAGGTHGVHENNNAGPSASEMENATALMRQGHGQQWRSIVFKDILNHPLFN